MKSLLLSCIKADAASQQPPKKASTAASAQTKKPASTPKSQPKSIVRPASGKFKRIDNLTGYTYGTPPRKQHDLNREALVRRIITQDGIMGRTTKAGYNPRNSVPPHSKYER